jgi:hypothetical protein
MEIEKFISYQIESQFPAIYRESGKELVDLVKSYYQFLESQPSQSLYEGRRLFEYRDIDTTLESLLIFYQKKYLSGLPFNEKNIRFIIKHILDLYRRKGTEEGLQIFFRLFFDQDVKVYYPSEAMLKPSESTWNVVTYIQMFSDDPEKFRNLVGRRIFGSVSKAEATVNKILFMLLNGNIVPVIFLNNVKGKFVGFDNIFSRFDTGEFVNYGRVYGSLTGVEIDRDYFEATTGNQVGDLLEIDSDRGEGSKLIVTQVNTSFTGEISYRIRDGGWGYTTEDTLLLVSNQTFFLKENFQIEFGEREIITDQFGNQGIFIGRNDRVVGIRLREDDEFVSGVSVLSKSDSTVIEYDFIVEKNDSSPGPLFPEAANNELTFATKLNDMTNIENISLITDIIGDFVDVPLDSSNYNDVPPAQKSMSGTADPVNINTPLNLAFDLTPFDIGTIVNFINVNPGSDYINDVFTQAHDPVIRAFNRSDQIITVTPFSATFTVGAEIQQGNIRGKIRRVIPSNVVGRGSLIVTPYAYYGFSRNQPITFNGVNFNVLSISTDFASRKFGYNADIRSSTEFAIGKIEEVNVVDSGFGYVDLADKILVKIRQSLKIVDFNTGVFQVGDEITQSDITGKILEISNVGESILVETDDLRRLDSRLTIGHKNNEYEIVSIDVIKFPVAKGKLSVRGQGITQGSWTTLESQLNSEDGKVIQDSFFFQDFSYEILSRVGIEDYIEPLKDVAHPSGMKVFGRFNFEENLGVATNAQMVIRTDFIEPVTPLVGADSTLYFADSTILTADNDKDYKYSSDDISITADITGITSDIQ